MENPAGKEWKPKSPPIPYPEGLDIKVGTKTLMTIRIRDGVIQFQVFGKK